MKSLINVYKKMNFVLGNNLKGYLYLFIFLGLLVFLIEGSLIISVKMFLTHFGISDSSPSKTYELLEHYKFLPVALLVILTLLRSIIMSVKIFTVSEYETKLLTIIRKRIIKQSLMSNYVIESVKLQTIFSDISLKVSSLQANLAKTVISLSIFSLNVILMLFLTWKELLTGLGLTSLLMLLFYGGLKSLKAIGRDDILNLEAISSQVLSIIRNIKFIKASAIHEKVNNISDYNLEEYYKIQCRKLKITSLKQSMPSFFATISLIITCYLSINYYQTPPLKTLTFFFFFYRSLMFFGEALHSLTITDLYTGHVDRLEEFLKNNLNNHNTKILTPPQIDEIELRNVSFHRNDRNIFKDVSFKLKKGQLLLIEGASGAGKSTLLDLVLGFLKTREGNIFINNIEQDIPRHKISYIGPESALFPDTIENNITLFKEHKTTEDILIGLARELSLEKIVNKDTLSNVLSFPLKISTGEQKRLELMRAILRKPDLLILDEFTANLDEQNIKKIISIIKDIKKDVIIILTSHVNYFEDVLDFKIKLSTE